MFLGANLDLFPLSGFVSENFDELSTGGKILDLFHHAAMPLACYLVGSFAFMTFMMKNNLMDNLAADYVRTAISKGAPFRSAVFHHAFRNSIIPIATTIGQNVTLMQKSILTRMHQNRRSTPSLLQCLRMQVMPLALIPDEV